MENEKKKEAEQHRKLRLKKKEELNTLRAFGNMLMKIIVHTWTNSLPIDAFHQRMLSTAQRTNLSKCPS